MEPVVSESTTMVVDGVLREVIRLHGYASTVTFGPLDLTAKFLFVTLNNPRGSGGLPHYIFAGWTRPIIKDGTVLGIQDIRCVRVLNVSLDPNEKGKMFIDLVMECWPDYPDTDFLCLP
jgi:hypothetical protein